MRVLWQSFLDPELHERYFLRLRTLLRNIAPETDFDVVGLRPPDRHLHALTEVRCGIAALRNALYAEREGYDGVVLGHFQEPLLREIRLALVLPVIGLGESSLLKVRGTFGLLAIAEAFVPWHEDQVHRHGIEDRFVGVQSVEIQPDGFMAAMEGGGGQSQLRGIVESTASALVAAGAETVVPAGALIPVALSDELGAIEIRDGCLLNCVAVAAHAAAAARPRRRHANRSPAAVDEFLEATGGPLVEPLRSRRVSS